MVLKMVLMEVDHAMNVEGNREAAKLANWFTKRSVMTSSVTSLSTLLASFSTTLSINWSITIPNTTSPHLRCHKNSQAIWRSSVGLPGSPVVFMSQKSVFSETPCTIVHELGKCHAHILNKTPNCDQINGIARMKGKERSKSVSSLKGKGHCMQLSLSHSTSHQFHQISF